MEKILNTPELRFPEFEGEWICVKLKSLLEFKNGINASKEQYGVGVKFINVLDILSNDFITYEKISGRVNVSQDIVEKYAVRFGDILFQRSSETREEVGSASVYMDSDNVATFGGFVIRGRKIGKYDPIFLNKLLKTDIARDTITSKSGGSTRYNVSQEILSEVELTLPSLPEQQKIAQFLTSVDEKIQALKKKKSLLEQYKKGMMQKIFSQELRFKDENGNEFPEWEEKKLGDLGDVVTGSTPPTNQSKYYGGKYLFVSPADLDEHRFIRETRSTLTSDGFLISRIIRKGSSLFVCIGSTIGKVGQAVDDCITNQQLNSLVPSSENSDDFIYSLLEFHSPKIKMLAATQAVPIINKTTFSNYLVVVPLLVEQTKIAAFFRVIDKKIEHVGNQLAKMEQWKKGLLQKMFV